MIHRSAVFDYPKTGINTVTTWEVTAQRYARRKRIHFFDSVSGIIFVAALACYA